jgi:hypothetical protein
MDAHILIVGAGAVGRNTRDLPLTHCVPDGACRLLWD